MNKLIKIIKFYFPEMGGFEEELAKDLANKLVSSGLVFEKPIERMAAWMKYDPYVKRYITLEDYIKECFGGLPSESLLEEAYNKLPDHPGSTGIIRVSFTELYEAMEDVRTRTEKKEKQRIVEKIQDLRGRMKGGEWIVNDDDIDAIFSEIIDNL